MAVRMLGLFMLFPVMSIYAADYDNSSPFLIGMAIGIYGLTQAIFQIPFGYLSDRFGRKPMLIFGLLIFFLGSLIAANTDNILIVIVGRALQGGGAISAVLMAFLADSTSEDNRAKANAFVGFQIGVAFMLSLIIGPIITSRVGLHGLFWVIALLSIIALIIVLTLPYSKPVTYYRLSASAFKEILNAQLLRLDFSIFSLHLILASGFIVMPILIIENQIIEMIDNWRLYLPAVLLSFLGMLPLIIISPSSGLSTPTRVFMSVDLPAPLSPIKPTISPLLTDKDALLKAVIPPKRLATFFNSIIGFINYLILLTHYIFKWVSK